MKCATTPQTHGEICTFRTRCCACTQSMHPKFSDEAISTSAFDTANMFRVEASAVDIEEKISRMPSTPTEGVGTQGSVDKGVHAPNTVHDAVHTSSTMRDRVGRESNSSPVEVSNMSATSMDVGVQIAGRQPIGNKSVLRIQKTDRVCKGVFESGKIIVHCLKR